MSIKVLHVSTPTSWRGGEQQMRYLIEELTAFDVQSFVFCSKGGVVEQFCTESNIPFRSQKEVFAVNPTYAKSIAKYCHDENIDLIHVHDSHAHTFAVMSASLFGNKTPIVVSRRVDFPISKSPLSRYKYNHPQAVRILCVSDAIKAIMAKDIERPERLETVHSGINLNRFRPIAPKGKLRNEFQVKTKYLVGNVAALAPHKDYHTFIETVKVLVQKGLDATYLIIGDGPMREQVEQWVKESGVSEHIIMTGFRNDIPEILPDLDLFLITSETEGLGTSILDAFACQAPVVATQAGGIPEIVRPDYSGILAPVKDSNKLAEGVLKMLNDETYKQKMIAGSQKILETFTTRAVAERTSQVYREILH